MDKNACSYLDDGKQLEQYENMTMEELDAAIETEKQRLKKRSANVKTA